MPKDVIITPASGKLDFYAALGSSVVANINLNDNNDLSISTTSGNLIIGDASRDVYIGDGSSNVDIVFEQDGEIRPLSGKTLFIGASGAYTNIFASKIGINQNTLSSIPLDVYSSTSGATIFNVAGTNGSLFSVVDNLSGTLMSVNNNAGLPVLEVFSDDSIVGGRFGQNDFVISSSGSIGIGTSNPTCRLEVVSSGTAAMDIGCFSNASGVEKAKISINASGDGTLSLMNNAGSTNIFLASANGNSYINAGNVGIGTATPTARLHATIADGNSVLLLNRSTTLAGISLDFTSGFSNLRSYYGLKIFTGSTTANAGTERVHFTDTGLVGIGTSTPSGQLHVIGTGIFTGDVSISGSVIVGSGSAAAPSFEFVNDADTGMFSPAGNTIGLATSGVERLRISSIGSVGIGTSSPVSRSHIYGGLTVDPLGVPTNNYSEGIRIGAASNGFSFVAFGVNPASATGSTTNQWWAGKNGATGGFTIYGNEAGESLHITTGSTVEIKGRTTLREGYFYEDGDAITREIVLLAQTTDSTPADMTFSGSEIMINYDRTYTFSALITARECSINGHVAGYKIEGVVTDQDGLATIVGTPVVTVFAEDNPDWDVIPSIYSAGMDNYLKFTVYPHAVANRNIRWVAKVTIVEVGTNGTGY